jgi:glycosyltransferase involved in cell wall biosynthesis
MATDSRTAGAAGPEPAVALLAWGNVLEDFLDPLGVSLEAFCKEFRGSWIFGYATALQRAGLRPVLIYASRRVGAPRRVTHEPTGATIHLLPVPLLYRLIERRMIYPYGQTVTQMFGNIHGRRRVLLPLYALAKELALYLATPPIALERVLRREQCTVVLCQEYEYPRFDVCVLIGKLTKRRVFGCFQGGNYHHSKLEGIVRRFSIRASTGLIIGPESEFERVASLYAPAASKVGRIFNPIDTDVWRPDQREEARAELDIPLAADVAVWHGRVVIDKKGLDLLLDAWERVQESRRDGDVRLLLVGTGDDAPKLERRLQAGAFGAGVLWINRFLHDAQVVRRYLSAGDVYVFPSRYEGFPVAPLEAMACGLPVVATDVEGVREIFADGEASGGVVVPRNDADALGAALGGLLKERSRRRELGLAARRRAESTFSLEATGERLRSFIGPAA